MIEQIEAIRNEIKRLKDPHEGNLNKPMERGRIGYAHGCIDCCDKILDFLDTLSEEHDKDLSEKIAAAYQLGLANKEEQMMKGAVEGEVCGRVYDHINIRFADGVCKFLEPKNISHIPADVSKYKVGEKVRIIIVKEDER